MKYLFAIIIVLVIFFIAHSALADDRGTWFCEQQTAKRDGNVLSVCGIGFGMDEGTARHAALTDSLGNFHTLCDASVDCSRDEAFIEPGRTSCSKQPNTLMKCYQLVVITLKNK